MLFSKKEKMNIGEFLAILLRDITKIKASTYEDYLEADNQRVLSKEEFENFNSQIMDFWILLVMAKLMELGSSSKVKVWSKEAGGIFMSSLQWALGDNEFSEDVAMNVLETFKKNLNEYSDYLQTLAETDLRKNGFIYYACMLFSQRFMGKVDKMGTYAALINNNKKLVNEYSDNCFKSVKIV